MSKTEHEQKELTAEDREPMNSASDPTKLHFMEALLNTTTGEKRFIYAYPQHDLVLVVKLWDDDGPVPTVKIFQRWSEYQRVKSHWRSQTPLPKSDKSWQTADGKARAYIRLTICKLGMITEV
jgi:hypothetical protein